MVLRLLMNNLIQAFIDCLLSLCGNDMDAIWYYFSILVE